MSNAVYLFIFVVVIVALVLLRMPKRPRDPLVFPYQSREHLVSPAERSFLGLLDQVLSGEHYRVFAKVRLADVVQVDKGLGRAAWQRAFNAIGSKHVDFVICRSEDMAFMGAIELDDASHGRGKRKERDGVVDKILEAAGIPLIRIPAAASYAPNDLKNLLSEEMGLIADNFAVPGNISIVPETNAGRGSEESASPPRTNPDMDA